MELRERLGGLMEEIGISQEQVAKSVGMSPAVINQYLAGKYQGDVAGIDRKIKAYLARVEDERTDGPIIMPIVQTTVYRKVHEVARICHIRREMGLVYGPAGAGKTEALRAYVAENPDCFLIETNPLYSTADLCKAIHRLLVGGCRMPARNSTNDVIDLCVDKLQGSGRLLICDEAEALKPPSLNTLRRIHDKAGIGILLSGLDTLKGNLFGRRGELQQLYSRIKISRKLTALEEEDAEKIVRAALPKYAELWPHYYQECHGITRILANLIEASIRVAKINNCPISAKVIKAAAETVMR